MVQNKMYALGVLVILAAAAPLLAQSSTADIAGLITDESGAAIASARIIIRNTAPGETRQLRSGASGSYVVSQLLPGQFDH